MIRFILNCRVIVLCLALRLELTERVVLAALEVALAVAEVALAFSDDAVTTTVVVELMGGK